MTKFIFISDTHNQHRVMHIPDGDVLIHAGDFTTTGSEREVEEFNAWLGTLPHTYKIVVPGNHDLVFEDNPGLARAIMTNADHVLIHEECMVYGVKVFGSPWTPWFHDWAFNYKPVDAEKVWSAVPNDTKVLVTHGPPFDRHDKVGRGLQQNVGCPKLRERVETVKPLVHVFGHIHEGHGSSLVDGTHFINASMLDMKYRPGNKAYVFNLP